MTPVTPSPIASASGGSRLLGGLLVLALVGLVVVVTQWPEPPPDVQKPTAPGAVGVGETTCRSIALSWGKATDDSDVTGYDVYHDGQHVTGVGGDQLAAVIAGEPATTWNIHVTARDEAGNVSPASASVAVTPPQCGSDTKAPSAPGGVKATADGTTVTTAWAAATDDVRVTAYDVFRDGNRVGTVAATGDAKQFTFLDFGVPAATNHRYQVSARDSQGNVSGRSAGADVTAGAQCTLLCSITPVAKDTDLVWGLVELPDGSVLYARRDKREIVRLDPRTGQATSLGQVPGAVSTGGDGGVLGLTIAPTFAKDHWIYVFYTTASDNRIARLRLRGASLDTGSMQSLLVGIPRAKSHNGGRLRFGPDGKLYAATGDAQNPRLAQDNNSLAGKVLRFNPDGKIPAGNPFGGYIWSLGHRNPQGLAFDSRGWLWSQESGDKSVDETNYIAKGGNYGWPLCEGTESKSGTGCDTHGFEAPFATFGPSDGLCSGMAIVRDIGYLACAGGARLYRVPITDEGLTDMQPLLVGAYGPLIAAEPGRDGTLWITTRTGTETQILRIMLPPAA
ncbi:PQQ-dependent sugar dehydrogenase [Catellatospora tritici]|uniref:PQQ-dependent sugar dehydrogenase n=1 Tax=Catellatospora tritici TaxID=2851566 RepID=UPI001C2D9E3D|nr:PQQ-dependent sugar dehydrogenase [Catellatospora tritici]MBV1855968.1 PQQ-dependent sugar dehydrogenase [Catellatospora tritici]